MAVVTNNKLELARKKPILFTQKESLICHSISLEAGDDQLLVHDNIKGLHFDGNILAKTRKPINDLMNAILASTTLKTLTVGEGFPMSFFTGGKFNRSLVSKTLCALHLFQCHLEKRAFMNLIASLKYSKQIEHVSLVSVEDFMKKSFNSFCWANWLPVFKQVKRFEISTYAVTQKDALSLGRVFQTTTNVTIARFHLMQQPYEVSERGKMWRLIFSATEKCTCFSYLLLDSYSSPMYVGNEFWNYIEGVISKSLVLKNVSSMGIRPRI